MTYGIEVNGRLFERTTKEKLAERLEIIRQFYPSAEPVKIHRNGDRVQIYPNARHKEGKPVMMLH